jgi:signal transduction histidine kinase
MTRVALKLLLMIGIVFLLQRAVAASSSGSDANLIPNISTLVTNVAQLRALSRADLDRGRPCSLTGTVTMVDNDKRRIVLQDATGAVMWYSDKPIDTALAGKMVRLTCPDARIYATTFPNFPFRPSGSDIESSFVAPSNWGDYHLTRMAARLHPPKSGDYRFWIASDDSSELWLSADENPAHVRKIAGVMEGFWTDPNEWDRFPSQRSESIYLRSDKSYYIEVFQEQGLQNDHLSVAWEGPGIERAVIPGESLTPWNDQRAAMNGKGDESKGVLREYWTNYTVGSLTPLMPVGPADAPMGGRDVLFEMLGPGAQPAAQAVNLREPLLPENNFRLIQTEGTITFVSTNGTSAILELASGTKRASVMIAKADPKWLHANRNWRVRVRGVCEGATDVNGELNIGFIWVPESEDVELLETANADKESVAPADSPADSATGSGGFYSARGTVMFDGRFSGQRYLYIRDIGGSVRVSDADRLVKDLFEVGQRVQVGGTVFPGKVGFHLIPKTVRLLGWQSLPLPEEVGEGAAYRDGQWTEVEGVVRSIRSDGLMSVNGAGGFVSVWCPAIPFDSSSIDCTVRIRGVISLDTPDSPLLLVGSGRFFKIEEQGPNDPFSLPRSRINSLEDLVGAVNFHRVKVEGTVTCVNEQAVYLQDDSGAVRLQAEHFPGVHPGERVEAVGFPDASGSVPVLADSELRATGTGLVVTPRELNSDDAFANSQNGSLVEARGILLAEKNRDQMQTLELQSGQRIVKAVLAAQNGHLPSLAAGSLLKVTGVCVADFIPVQNAKTANRENPSMVSLQILLRAPTDVIIQRGPPWWTPMKVIVLVGFLLIVLGGTFLWVHLLGKRYERRQRAQLEFSRQILQGQETERRRIAANLHDSLGQNLLVIKNQVHLAMQSALDRTTLSKRLGEISGMATQVIEEVRQITHDLRPYQLERVGLTQTLRGTIRRVSEASPIAFASHVDEVDGLFESDGEIHIYRIIQEALNNVVKHSQATEATVVVRKEPNSVSIIVRDNGRGFAGDVNYGHELSRAGFGLSGIDERARILHGKVSFDSRPEEGFRVTVEIPLTLPA